MGIPLPVEATLDERAANAAAARAERVFAQAGRDAGTQFSRVFSNSAQEAEQALKKVGDKASDAYDKARDAAGKLRAEEERLQQVRDSGGRNDQIVAQAERVERARRAEIRAIRDATNAYSEYEQAAENAGRNGGQSFMDGIRGSISGAGQSGQDMANDLASGFAGSSALLRLGAAAGPLGLALAGAGALGLVAGKAIAGGIADGMATIQMQDLFQARMGLDEASMGRYADAAGAAYANNFGASVADNLGAAQVALQSGLIDTSSTDGEVQAVVEQLQGMTSVTDASTAELSRSITQLMRTGLASNISEASDIIVSGFQQGLNVSDDWLDTINEYSTQFRKLGLDAGGFMTLLQQGLQGGARDTDLVADSLKEFSIRAVDGSKSTTEGFEALGFNAQEMGRRFAEGGDSAKVALGATLEALQSIRDPQQQALVWQRLFGTQWEDMGDAVKKFDLSTVSSEFTSMSGNAQSSTKTAASNFKSEWDEAARAVEQRFDDLKTSLAEWVSPTLENIARGVKELFEKTPTLTPGAPGVPAFQQYGPYAVTGGPAINPPATVVPGTNPLDVLARGPVVPPVNLPAPGPDYYKQLYPLAPSNAPVQGDAKPIPLDGESTKPTFDPSQYSLDSIPIGQFVSGISMPGGSGVGPMGTTALGAPAWNAQQQAYGQYVVDQGRVFDAETSRLSAKASAESARIRVLELDASGTATQQEITAAKMAALTAERQYQSAAMKLAEAQQGTWKKLESTASKFANGMGDIGAALDNDFGISDGLPGIAENIVKLVASIAMAPMTGMLSAVQTASGYSGGSGLVGILGAQGAFGQPQMPGVQPGVATAGGMQSLAQPGESARDFAHRAMMPYWQNQGYTVGDHAADAHGEHQNGALDIMVPSIEAGAAVLQQVLSDPNVYGAIFNNQTFGYGHGATPQDYSAGHTGDPNQDHQNHVHVWYKPGESGNINPTGAPPSLMGTSGVAATSGATPVFVVNMPGGGFSPGGLPSAASTPAGAGAAAGLWDRVAQAESSGNWQDNNSGGHSTSSGAPRGGLQITDGTWNAFGGGDFAPSANLATREQQIEVANRIAFGGYNGTPPQGLGAWEAITKGMVPGVSAGTPASAFGVGPTIPAGTGLPAGISPSSAFQPTPPPGGGMGTGIGPGGVPIPRSAPIGGQAFPGAGSGGFQGVGGMPLAALSTAASGLDMLAPGAGQAAQIGIQLANRAAAFAGQAAGIGVSGLFETLLPSGDNPMASIGNSWFGKIAGGFAGARPALPNMAGQQQAPPNPNDGSGQPGAAGKAGDKYDISVTNHGATEQQNADSIRQAMEAKSGSVTPGKQ